MIDWTHPSACRIWVAGYGQGAELLDDAIQSEMIPE